MKSPRCVYSIDWLQIYCHVNKKPEVEMVEYVSPMNDKWGNHRIYKLNEGKEYIKGYAIQRSITWKGYTVAHIAWEPLNVNNDKECGAIKIANPVLYTSDWHFILADILKTLDWTAKNITRVDIACDFNYFINGLHPETFIRKYMTKTQDTYIRKGSNKWSAYGQKEVHRNTFDYIRWGSRQSGVAVYLYNKSKELRQQKYKPWIADLWKQHSLNVENTWRVEFSINSSGRGLRHLQEELIHSLWVDDLYKEQAIESIFKVYAKQYFIFHQVKKNGAKKKKDMPIIYLLPTDTELMIRPTKIYQAERTNKAEWQTITRLRCLKHEIEEEGSLQNMNLLLSLQSVIDIYIERALVLHKCQVFREQIQSDISQQIKRHQSMQTIRQRASALQHIKTDNEYLQECAERIAKKVTSMASDGILW